MRMADLPIIGNYFRTYNFFLGADLERLNADL
jgi:hypothetical protein